MKPCLLNVVVISSVLVTSFLSVPVLGSSVINNSLKQFLWETKDLLKLCASSNHSHWDCLKQESLSIVDDFVSSEKIPLLAGAALVRVDNDYDNTVNISENVVNTLHDDDGNNGTVDGTWQSRVLGALDTLFQTHVLQINFLKTVRGKEQHNKKNKKDWLQQYYRKMKNQNVVEGRHRRHRQQMIPMMIFGVTVFGMFVIPIGFQFLAALSGKAFLMAKLALLLASINGLKRVASAGVHYGLYHTIDPHHSPHSPGVFYDRESTFGPRNSPPIE
ncbi:uncharacterized protein LOC131425349 [Malaya genurostris]|uniref:uncharacterized protein LOC131425349 n=1 Tax=Malaya genurostris TaxID=325434 RepID=UPI0026F3FAC2|nr:uncharacterized protein LOC131425349 [Malaya genurostris]